MQKYTVIMLITLMSLSTTKAQKGQALLPKKSDGSPYSKVELRNHILNNPEYSLEFWSTIQGALDRAGIQLKSSLDNRSIDWALSHIEFSTKKIGPFMNSYKIGKLIYFFKDAGYNGIVGTFNYLNCHEDILKAECVNFIHPIFKEKVIIPEPIVVTPPQPSCPPVFVYVSQPRVTTLNSEPENAQHIPRCGCCGEFHMPDGYCKCNQSKLSISGGISLGMDQCGNLQVRGASIGVNSNRNNGNRNYNNYNNNYNRNQNYGCNSCGQNNCSGGCRRPMRDLSYRSYPNYGYNIARTSR